MKRQITLFTFLAVSILFAGDLFSNSDGALNLTGAPGEGDCSACHRNNQTPDPNSNIEITIDGNPTFYEPGKTYTIYVQANYPGLQRFGFGFSVRKPGVSFVSEGQLLAIPDSGIRVSDFVTHSAIKTYGQGSRKWAFRWKAPETNVGELKFYVSGIASNNDNSADGDFLIQDSLTFSPQLPNSIEEEDGLNFDISLVPNENTMFASFVLEESERVLITMYNMEGRLMKELFDSKLNRGDQILKLNFPDQLPGGIYTIEIDTPTKKGVKKIVIR
ncbi:MAG: choice-of-anchor V domain-containing protein [Bacteroidia bacterium]